MLPLEIILAQLPTPKKDRELPSTIPGAGKQPTVNPDLEKKFDQFFKTPDFTTDPKGSETDQKRREYHDKVMGALDDELGGNQFYQPGQSRPAGPTEPGDSKGKIQTAHLVTTASRLPKAVQLVKNTRTAVDTVRVAQPELALLTKADQPSRVVRVVTNANRTAKATEIAIKGNQITRTAAIGSKVTAVGAKANVVLAPIAAGLTGIDSYNYWTDAVYSSDEVLEAQGYKKDEFDGVRTERYACATVHTASMATGATIGCVMGVKAGLVGAGIGTLICPGIGTVAGAIIGGVFGFLSGLAIGGLVGDVVNSFIDRRGIARQFIENLFKNESKELYKQLEEKKKAELEESEKSKKKKESSRSTTSGEVKVAGLETLPTISSAVYA